MKPFLLTLLLIAATAAGDTTMQIRNGVLQTDMNANNFKITNSASPVSANDLANKAYVDSHGGGGGGGTPLSSLSLAVPTVLFFSPVNFDLTDPANPTGTMTIKSQNTKTFFGNPSVTGAAPVFMTQSEARLALNINNVDNTTDLNKPVSNATATAISDALAAFTGNSFIATVGTISSGTWAANIIGNAYLPTLDSIRAPATNLSLGGFKIINLGDPTSGTDAATKNYVDSVAAGGPPHVAVVAATTANITLSGEQTIDGVTTSGSRVLVKNQTAGANNGIYVTGSSGWTRATDADTGIELSGNVFVTGGSVNGTTQWGVTTPQPIVIGTTPVSYTLTGASTIYSAGNGLSLTGTVFSAVGTLHRISVTSGGIDIASDYAGQSSITTLGTTTPVTTGTWNASVIAGQYGGTGTANTGRTLTIGTASVPAASVSGSNTGDISIAGENYLSLSGQVLTAGAVDLSSTNAKGVLAAARFPALTGAVTNTSGDLTTVLSDGVVGTSKLANSAVTYGKMQSVTFSKLLGNPNTTGTPAPVVEIGIGSGLAFAGTPTAPVLVTSGTGTITGITAGNLNLANPSPTVTPAPTFFSTAVTGTTTPNIAFTATNAPANSFLGNPTAGATPPSYIAATTARQVMGAGDVSSNVPTGTVDGEFAIFSGTAGKTIVRPPYLGNGFDTSSGNINFTPAATGVVNLNQAQLKQGTKTATFDISGLVNSPAVLTATDNSVWVIPSKAGDLLTLPPSGPIQAPGGIDTTGTITWRDILPDPIPNNGKFLQAQANIDGTGSWVAALPESNTWVKNSTVVGSTIFESTANNSYQWNPIAGQSRQNGIIYLNGTNHTLIMGSGLQSGMIFNLIVVQDPTTPARLTFQNPANFMTPSGGAGVLAQTMVQGAVDWYQLQNIDAADLTRQSFKFIAKVEGLNMTAATATTCNTINYDGPNSGITGQAFSSLSTGADKNLWMQFIATAGDALGVCRIDVNMFETGGPNYSLKAGIYPDAVRFNRSTGTTTTGLNTLTETANGVWATRDINQRITFASSTSGYSTTGVYYVCPSPAPSGISPTIGICSDRSGTAANAGTVTAVANSVATSTYGTPNIGTPSVPTIIGAELAGPNSGTIPAFSTAAAAIAANQAGAPNADSNPTSFTNIGAIPAATLVNGTAYWVRVYGDTSTFPAGTSLTVLYPGSAPANGYNNFLKNDLGTTQLSLSNRQLRLDTYHSP